MSARGWVRDVQGDDAEESEGGGADAAEGDVGSDEKEEVDPTEHLRHAHNHECNSFRRNKRYQQLIDTTDTAESERTRAE